MRKYFTRIFIFVTALLATQISLYAQGCSDAGACSLHSIKNNAGKSWTAMPGNNQLMVGFSFGIGEENTQIYSPYIEYVRKLKRTSVAAKVNYAAVTGDLGNTNGLGDLYLTVAHDLRKTGTWETTIVASIKLPLHHSNRMKDGRSLPMPYQTSLGTTDLLLGINLKKQAWGFALAWQQPLTKTNDNEFMADEFSNDSPAADYFPSNLLQRKGDLVGRASYAWTPGGKWQLRPSILGIYHLGNDRYVNMMGERVTLFASTGLTLNGNFFIGHPVGKGWLELGLGAPVIVREQRPDGLTRSFVAAVEYRISF